MQQNQLSHKTVIQKPVIFIAIANDRVNSSRYLRNLADELRHIRKSLSIAENKGLCEIVERTGASISDIFNVFQDERYNGRIAIFHYGGHADGYKLLLESSGGEHSLAFRDGLVPFLACQQGLKLIFLNACSTEQHALDLITSGIPSVIGTSQKIKDKIAASLAARFYNGIGNGLTIEQAWQEAENEIWTVHRKSNYSALYQSFEDSAFKSYEEYEDRSPWRIFFKQGAEKIKSWSLPEASNDPLFNLPEIPMSYPLPEKPFLFLSHFERKHAEIYFGRSYYIRDLYERVTRKNSCPVILLYGQSGVGKSSLLDAGLLPRLENSFNVVYSRTKEENGLSDTLKSILKSRVSNLSKGLNIENSSTEVLWKEIESRTNKPLIIILDQVEEIFTRQNEKSSNVLNDFMEEIKRLFVSPIHFPKGKLILSYRKEYHAEIEKKFRDFEIDANCVFVQPLLVKDVIEVIMGLTSSERLKEKYNLEIEPELPGIIADRLSEDIESPIAPVLQIILTKMWELSRINDVSPNRRFTTDLFLELKKEGLLLGDFFKLQMEKLGGWNMVVIQSGLALDLLKFHTTEWSTGCGRKKEAILDRYGDSWENDVIDALVIELKQLYLLADSSQNKDEICLAHDTLAPIIINEFNNSDKPGQRASRVLAAKVNDFEKDKNSVFLDEHDLLTVESGLNGMRALTVLERELIEKSRDHNEHRKNQIKRFKQVRAISMIIIVLVAIFALWQWKTAVQNSRKIQADLFSYRAREVCEKDPTEALIMAKTAWETNDNEITRNTIFDIFRENCFYKIIAHLPGQPKQIGFSEDSQSILASFDNGTTQGWNLKGEEIRVNSVNSCKEVRGKSRMLENRYKFISMDSGVIHILDEINGIKTELIGHEGRICSSAFSLDKKTILTGSRDKTARLWNSEGKQIQVFRGHESAVVSVAFSPDGRYILTASQNNILRLWELKFQELKCFKGDDGEMVYANFSSDGKGIITVTTDGVIALRDMNSFQNRVIKDFKSNVTSASASPDGKNILIGFTSGTVCLLDMDGRELWRRDNHRSGISSTAFSMDGKNILTGSYDKTARLWDMKGNELIIFKEVKHRIMSVAFSWDGKYVLTGSYDKVARIWDKHGNVMKEFKDHKDWITAVAFWPDGQSILTGAGNKIIRWDLKGNAVQEFKGHEGMVQSIVFSPDCRYILAGSTDKKSILWDSKGNRLQEFIGHEGYINSAVFSRDCRHVLTGSSDGTARLWKVYTVEEFLKNGTYSTLNPDQK